MNSIGDIVEVNPDDIGGTDTNFANTDLTANLDRSHDMNMFNLEILNIQNLNLETMIGTYTKARIEINRFGYGNFAAFGLDDSRDATVSVQTGAATKRRPTLIFLSNFASFLPTAFVRIMSMCNPTSFPLKHKTTPRPMLNYILNPRRDMNRPRLVN